MALPAGLATVTVTIGPYLTADGAPASGRVRFVPEAQLLHTPSGSVILPDGVTVALDGTGAAQVVLPASDAPGITPTPFRYQVWWDLPGRTAPAPLWISLPAATPAVDLDALLPAASGSGPVAVPAVSSVAGLTGPVTAGDLAAAVASPLAADPTLNPNALTAGQATMLRHEVSTTSALLGTSGWLRLSYFTATKTEQTTKVRIYTGGTAAGATPTLCRLALYDVDPVTGNLTLLAATANDTTLFAATVSAYQRNFTAPAQLVAGRRYAVGVIVVSAAALPSFAGSVAISGDAYAIPPRMTGLLSGQTDLPATIAAGLVGQSASFLFAAVLP